MLNFVRAIESFDTPAIIALPARIEVFTTKIYREAVGRVSAESKSRGDLRRVVVVDHDGVRLFLIAL